MVARGRRCIGVDVIDEGDQMVQTSSKKLLSPGDITYRLVSIFNNSVLYTTKSLNSVF